MASECQFCRKHAQKSCPLVLPTDLPLRPLPEAVPNCASMAMRSSLEMVLKSVERLKIGL